GILTCLSNRNGIVKQQILKNITQEFVYNYEMKTADFLADLRNQKRNRKATDSEKYYARICL
ncbi:hypothetical protein, partial [Tenacibaculum finnmarkense]|uniref:hypothetical protein n=1 Tax=Tenacibaculum finnmarkense TaxID=2781243 RepID=UPI001A7E9D80